MPYLKCVPCKIRVSTTDVDTALTDESCPSCGRALESVADLTEVVGFRSRDLLDPSVPAREVEIDRWLDEGGSEGREPLAQAVAVELLPPGSRPVSR